MAAHKPTPDPVEVLQLQVLLDETERQFFADLAAILDRAAERRRMLLAKPAQKGQSNAGRR